jgi:hypothetical protein
MGFLDHESKTWVKKMDETLKEHQGRRIGRLKAYIHQVLSVSGKWKN